MQSEVVIEAKLLTKKFGDLMAVDSINFHVFRGECFGFLGPNGAGKTTTIKMANCVLPLTAGNLTVAGMDVTRQAREIKSMIGVAPQEDNLDPDFTVFHNLIVYARYFDLPKAVAQKRADELLKFVQLEEKRNVRIDQLSAGMKRRLILARALINEPQILILDEPTTGLDPQARHLIWDKTRSLQKQGVTIVLTTHYMEEAAQLCDRLLIMDNGKIIEEGMPADLIRKHAGEEVLEVAYDQEVMEFLKKTFPDARLDVVADRIQVFTNQPKGVFAQILRKFDFKAAMIRDANLEDVFLKLTGRRLKE
ncbi:MAG TPA: ATP-binding cassette domain-containing protein [Candidatus Bathyarchaeia archaeon]|nr:ATP-binding cassette domain-containing protein [Candidatus Bathyarchaeia archaeon]